MTLSARPADFTISAPEHIRNLNRPRPLSRALRICITLMAQIRIGALDIVLPDGRRLRFQGQEPGPEGVLVLHRERVIRRFLARGKLGFCESYLDGDWSSPDIATFFEMILRNMDSLRRTLLGRPWIRMASRLFHITRPNSRQGSRRNIYSHYDIGNAFYAAWLDPSMTYSSALFEQRSEDLQSAQERKYAEILRRLDVKPGMHILEIGCGWGGFALHAARRREDVRVTAITLSRAQYEYACARVAEAGLEQRVEIRLQDYRDIRGSYDRIASIEMFEAVGEAYWPVFFGKLRDSLKPGGRSVLQIITIDDEDFKDYRKSADFIQRYIFPGGMLPSRRELSRQAAHAGLSQTGIFAFGQHYARTLEHWNRNFQQAWPRLQGGLRDARFKRLWELYLSYCQAGFETGKIDVIHLTLDRPDAVS